MGTPNPAFSILSGDPEPSKDRRFRSREREGGHAARNAHQDLQAQKPNTAYPQGPCGHLSGKEEEKGVGMATLEQAWVETDYRPAAPNPHWLPSVDRPDLETPHPGYTHRSACPAMFLLPPHPPLPENTHGRCSPVDTPQSFHKPLVIGLWRVESQWALAAGEMRLVQFGQDTTERLSLSVLAACCETDP